MLASLLVSTLDFGSSRPGPNPTLIQCKVFLELMYLDFSKKSSAFMFAYIAVKEFSVI